MTYNNNTFTDGQGMVITVAHQGYHLYNITSTIAPPIEIFQDPAGEFTFRYLNGTVLGYTSMFSSFKDACRSLEIVDITGSPILTAAKFFMFEGLEIRIRPSTYSKSFLSLSPWLLGLIMDNWTSRDVTACSCSGSRGYGRKSGGDGDILFPSN